jgi:2-succinyl-5-enolpyruvyl-6-hydroxy-3-cyclohexene-1-carboxylate synthase
MFREPLAPIDTKESFSSYLKDLESWMKNSQPYTHYLSPSKTLTPKIINSVADILTSSHEGAIVVGRLSSPEEQKALLDLAHQLNWPVFPDISSQLRLGTRDKNIISYYDLMLLSSEFINHYQFDCILHVGGRITSKRWYNYIEALHPRHYLMVLNHPLRHDPLHNVTLRIEAPLQDFCRAITPKVPMQKIKGAVSSLKDLSIAIQEGLTSYFLKEERLSEPLVVHLITQHIPEKTALFVGNSLPIREMDIFASPAGQGVFLEANRGASGIDGNLATAAGIATGLKKPATVLIGDLAFLYDLNSLGMLTSIPQPLVIVVINNHGGGIFSFLPIAEFPDVFEKYFATPHSFQFDLVSQMFNIHYARAETPAQFVAEYTMAFVREKSTVIEIKTDRAENFQIQQNIHQKILEITNAFFVEMKE